ncbi:P-loop NTPase family protein [Nocardia salmonicida]|uniref:adenylate kinase n=1 Tax=Nocardia salmonicida TaxID=53431 RepID=UPI0007A45F8C|nr:adenylate kinase [Nocardia salmonicida]
MQRIVILGRGGAGKSTLARRLGAAIELPVIELDQHFWPPDLTPLPLDQWRPIQQRLTDAEGWILDGDLGPFDALEVRLETADTIVLLDFPLWICAWRALRRSRENLAFWRWLIGYRRHSLPVITTAIADHAPHATLRLLRHPDDVERFLAEIRDGPHRAP